MVAIEQLTRHKSTSTPLALHAADRRHDQCEEREATSDGSGGVARRVSAFESRVGS
jgi:hypothetical protein